MYTTTVYNVTGNMSMSCNNGVLLSAHKFISLKPFKTYKLSFFLSLGPTRYLEHLILRVDCLATCDFYHIPAIHLHLLVNDVHLINRQQNFTLGLVVIISALVNGTNRSYMLQLHNFE